MQLLYNYPFNCQPHKMVKHTQAIRRQQLTNCLSVFKHLMGFVFKWLLRWVVKAALNTISLSITEGKFQGRLICMSAEFV